MDLIKKDKRITPQVIGKALKMPVDEVVSIIEGLTESGIILATISKVGVDEIIERTLPNPLSEITDRTPRTLEQKIMYSYEVEPRYGPEPIIPTTRDFCRRLMKMDKFYSRSDIETISQRLGYSVWDRRGGWYGNKPSCRHRWVQNFVVRKK